MFGRSQAGAQCPVDSASREWLDRRWNWLVAQFGLNRLRAQPIILPSAEFFPDPFDGSEDDARNLLVRVCEYMDLDPAQIELHFYQDRNPVHSEGHQLGTAGLYQRESEKFDIWIEIANLSDALGFVSTLAHELAHIHLLGHGRITSEEPDHERLTDFLTVFLGMGVFSANAVIRERYWDQGVVSGWSIGRRGYLTMAEYGYALALLAQSRKEEQPEWANSLRPDVRDAFNKSQRFLASGEDQQVLVDPSSEEQELSEITDESEPECDLEPPLTPEELARRIAQGERDFRNKSFREQILNGLDLRGCNLAGADFDCANLSDVNMADCDLQEADMQEAILLRTNLRGANLNGVDFTSACLTGADLTGADIRGADFSDAMLEGTILVATQRNRATNFADADIAEVICDTDLSRETLTGTSTAESITLRYAKFSDHVAFFAVVWMAAVVGGLLGIVVGSLADRFLGKPTLGSYPAIFGAALGAFLGFRALVRRR